MDKDKLIKAVEGAKKGDSSAFRVLYDLTQQKAYYTALKFTKNEYDAQDMVQDAYVKAFSSLNKLDAPEKFVSWFNCIVANKCKDYLQKKSPTLFSQFENDDNDFDFESSLENEDKSLLPEEVTDNKETKRLVMQCIDKLPEEQKLCVVMFYYDEMPIKDIASSLEISEGTVKSRLNAARKKLKEEFKKLDEKGTKLYAAPFLPLMRWAFSNDGTKHRLPKPIFKKAAKAALVELNKKGTVAAAGSALSIGGVTLTNGAIATIVATAVIVTGTTVGTIVYNEKQKSTPADATQIESTQEYELDSFAAEEQEEHYLSYGSMIVGDKDNDKYYYVDNGEVKKSNRNGYEEVVICEGNPLNLTYTNDKLYFSSNGKLNSYDNTEVKELFDVRSAYIYPSVKGIIGINKQKSSAYLIDLESNEEKILGVDGYDIRFDDNKLYYRNSTGVSYYDLINSTSHQLFKYNSKERLDLPYFVNNGNVYFSDFHSDENGKIYYQQIGSNKANGISLKSGVIDFAFSGSKLYYSTVDDKLYSANKQGSTNGIILDEQCFFVSNCGGYTVWYSADNDASYIINTSNDKIEYQLNGIISDAQIIGNRLFYRDGEYSQCVSLSSLVRSE